MKGMFSLLHHQVGEIKQLLTNMYDKRGHAPHLPYARALQLFYMTLRHTQKELESIYFSYVLKPQLQAQNSIAISCVYLMLQLKALDQTALSSNVPNQCQASSVTL